MSGSQTESQRELVAPTTGVEVRVFYLETSEKPGTSKEEVRATLLTRRRDNVLQAVTLTLAGVVVEAELASPFDP